MDIIASAAAITMYVLTVPPLDAVRELKLKENVESEMLKRRIKQLKESSHINH